MNPTKPAAAPPSNRGTWLVLAVLTVAIGLFALRLGLQAYCCQVVDRVVAQNRHWTGVTSGAFMIEPGGPEWLSGLGGRRLDYLLGTPRIVMVELNDSFSRDEIHHVLWCISELQSLEKVGLYGSGVTDDDLHLLSNMESLNCLELVGTKVTTEGVATLKSLPKLKALTLESPAFDDAALVVVSQMPNLRLLELWETTVTDAGLKQLTALPRLEWLKITKTPISDTGLLELRCLTSLQHLDVSQTQVTDAGIDALRQSIPRLEVLDD